MKRIIKSGLMAGILVSVVALAGCATNTANASGPSPSGTAVAVNLSDPAAVAALCGTAAGNGTADAALAAFNKLVSSADSGQRNQVFKAWGVNPQDTKAVDTAQKQLEAQAAVVCKDSAATGSGTVGVQQPDGTTGSLPLVEGTSGVTTIVDTTTQAATPAVLGSSAPLLDIHQRYKPNYLTWAGLVERVGQEGWYADGVNSYASQTGFSWSDAERFASINHLNGEGKIVNGALVIQAYNTDMSNDQIYEAVAKWVSFDSFGTDAAGKSLFYSVPIQHVDGGFVNTVNVGTAASPKMGERFDTESMVRLSLAPIITTADGSYALDGSRGAGIFVDCGNVHWVPVAKWTCSDSACAKPICPAGTTGTPPNCVTPPAKGCPEGYTGTPPNCLKQKNWSQSPGNGWTPLQAGRLTSGTESQDQKAAGQTSGNVTDNQVAAGTVSGSTTSDLPKGTVVAPGASSGGDDQSAGATDGTVTKQDAGGTSGATCAVTTDPDTGKATGDCTK